MARRIRAANLETRSARLRLPVSKKPVWITIGHGLGIGYRRNQGPGTWSGRQADGKGGYQTFAVATADDYDTANGAGIMDFWQAQDRVRSTGLGAREAADGSKLVTVREAVDAYQHELERRGGDLANAARLRAHLPDTLAGKTVAMLVARDFKPWRDALTRAQLSPASINRINTCLKAALNLAAAHDERLTNRRAWQTGLGSIPDAAESRNVILSDQARHAVVASAYKVSSEFGLLTEVAASTGARVSQLARLEVRDLQADLARLMMPSSRKGRGRKRIDRYPVPIPAALAARLADIAQERPDDSALLVKPSGEPWRKSDHLRLFSRAAEDAGLDADATLYSLRHTNIARALLAAVPIRVVAANHDTSVAMIEKTYSRYIGDHSDTVARRALFDRSEPAGGNVVPLREHQ
jgi:integrase